jgi:hypothetical protein
MTEPRGVEERIDWFLHNDPSGPGMCAQHTWHALGGDRGNPPAWSCSDANQCVDKVKASGRYWTPDTWSGPPPRGAWVGYKYGNNGHACLSLGDGTIATTDPGNGQPVGVEDLNYPNKWGASGWDVWTDTYNGVRFDVQGISHGDVHLEKLAYGQLDSDSVRRLQAHLNDHKLTGGSTLPISGNLLEQTANELRLCREQHGFADSIGDETVSEAQVRHIIPLATCGCVLRVQATTPEPPDPEPAPPETVGIVKAFGLWKWYSGKEDSKKTVHPDGEWHDIDLDAQPASGISTANVEEHFLYLRTQLPENRTATRTIETHFQRSDGDETAYWGPSYDAGAKDSIPYYNFHTESGSGLGGKWRIKVTGGTDPITYTTRYAKTFVSYQDDVEVAMSAAFGAIDLSGRILRRILRWAFRDE